MKKIFSMILTILVFCVWSSAALGHAHTHIGINEDQIQGTSDDNKLWFFSMPGTTGWPNWGEPLELVYQDSGLLAGYYVCEELECWHSAHPEDGTWQLGGDDELVEPDWQVGIERVSYDEGLMTLDEETFLPVLMNDGDRLIFPHLWMPDNYNENGTLGAWGFHVHTLFAVKADGVDTGETFSATFLAVDEGTTGYRTSDAYTINFVTVPEPATVLMLLTGTALVRRRRR